MEVSVLGERCKALDDGASIPKADQAVQLDKQQQSHTVSALNCI